jgi:hypothetical protein
MLAWLPISKVNDNGWSWINKQVHYCESEEDVAFHSFDDLTQVHCYSRFRKISGSSCIVSRSILQQPELLNLWDGRCQPCTVLFDSVLQVLVPVTEAQIVNQARSQSCGAKYELPSRRHGFIGLTSHLQNTSGTGWSRTSTFPRLCQYSWFRISREAGWRHIRVCMLCPYFC